MTEALITSVAPWFGGKRTMASMIVAELGTHRAYWELFAGSLAVLLSKPRTSHETVNDLHGDLVNLARVVAGDQWHELRDRLRRTHFCEPLFDEIKASNPTDDLGRAYRFFVECWMGRNGVAGTRASNTAFCVRYTANGGDPGRRFVNAVESIEAWNERLRGCWILQRDAFELVERIDDVESTAIYADPPYLNKGTNYVHDFAATDHQRLADALRRFRKARVVVSYYDDPRLADLYPGWTQRKIEVSKALAMQGRRGQNDTRAVEVLLINGPTYAAEKARELF